MTERPSGRLRSRPGLVTAWCAAAFAGLVLILALAELAGFPPEWIGAACVIAPIILYGVIAVATRARNAEEFTVAGRAVPPVANGLATAALSAAWLLPITGTLFLLGYDGLNLVLGTTGGFLLMAVLIVPYLRRSGAATVPEFLGLRYGGAAPRIVGAVALVLCLFPLLVIQVAMAGVFIAFLPNPDPTLAASIAPLFFLGAALGLAVVFAMLGGMTSLTWTQALQYFVVLLGIVVPVTFLWVKSTAFGGGLLPQLDYGAALAAIAKQEHELIARKVANVRTFKTYLQPFATYDQVNFVAIVVTLAMGTASLPHVLMRYASVPSSGTARVSAAWTLLFVFLLFVTAPAYAAFVKLSKYAEPAIRLGGTLPSPVDPLRICISELGCGYLPRLVTMPPILANLSLAGALAAALAAASAILFAIGSTLSHDLYGLVVDPGAPGRRRLFAARIALLVVAGLTAAALFARRLDDLLWAISWIFPLIAAAFFPAVVLGIWWRRANAWGCVAGMVAGLTVTLYYLVATRYFPLAFYEQWQELSNASPMAIAKLASLKKTLADAMALDGQARTMANWWGINPFAAAVFGVPIGFAANIIVSLLTQRPSAAADAAVEALRRPDSGPVLAPL